MSARTPDGPRSRRRLAGAMAVLVGLDAVGGLVAMADGLNTARQAWGPEARLAAPWVMILAQVGLTAVALGPRRRPALVAGVLLALACGISAISGFFDGGLADERLRPRHTAFQVLLLAWTALLGVLALDRARRVARGGTSAR